MKKIVIIGGGPAGLTCAYELLKKGEFEVVVLEQSENFGGISRTVEYNGNRMDIGGHRFFSKSEQVVDIWNELLKPQGKPSKDELILNESKIYPEDGADPETDDEVMLKRRRVSRILYDGKFFDYPVSLKMSTIKNMGLGNTFVAGCSYLKVCVKKRKENNLEDFYINRFGKKLYSMFFESYTEKLWGRHPSEIAADWGKQRVKGLSISAVIKNMFGKVFHKKNKEVETSLIEEFYYPKFGPGQLWESMAKHVLNDKNAKIIKGAKAVSFTGGQGHVDGVVYEKDGKRFTENADIVVSSMPLNELTEALPYTTEDALRIARGLPFRDFVTIGFLVDRLKLENKTKMKTVGNIVPDCWIYVQDKSVKLGRIQIFNNWSPYMVKDFENKVWIGLEYFSSGEDELYKMTPEEFKEFAENELVSLKIIDKGDVLDYHHERVEKAYCAYFDTYEEIDKLIEFLNEYENLYCIGRNGQHRYNNMDHSMLTAIETVRVITGEEKDRSVIWKVNTEKEYHEQRDGQEQNTERE